MPEGEHLCVGSTYNRATGKLVCTAAVIYKHVIDWPRVFAGQQSRQRFGIDARNADVCVFYLPHEKSHEALSHAASSCRVPNNGGRNASDGGKCTCAQMTRVLTAAWGDKGLRVKFGTRVQRARARLQTAWPCINGQ